MARIGSEATGSNTHEHDHDRELAEANAALDVLNGKAMLINDQIGNLQSLTETEKIEMRLALVILLRAEQQVFMPCSAQHQMANEMCQMAIEMQCGLLHRDDVKLAMGGSVDTMYGYFAKLRRREGKPNG